MSLNKTFTALVFCVLVSPIFAVNSRMSVFADNKSLDGKKEKVVVNSDGVMSLSMDYKELFSDLPDTWTVNCLSVRDNGVYVGTSPNGIIYFCGSDGEIVEIYRLDPPAKEEKKQEDSAAAGGAAAGEGVEVSANLHIFAMETAADGSLLAGLSGNECKLLKIAADGGVEELFDGAAEGIKYIFAIEEGQDGAIYLGTGPTGKVIRLAGSESSVVYTAKDKNIISLLLQGDKLYAGSDGRGVLYCISLADNTARIVYDSEQTDITDIVELNGDVYISATASSPQQTMMFQMAAEQEPDNMGGSDKDKKGDSENYSREDRIAMAREMLSQMNGGPSRPQQRPQGLQGQSGKPNGGGRGVMSKSSIVKIDSEGLAEMVYGTAADIFSIAVDGDRILAATGTKSSELISIDPASYVTAIQYEDETAGQITALAADGDGYIMGTSNPAKIIRVSRKFAVEGTYTSELIDAGQPSEWGVMRIDAEVPEGCEILYSMRTGNIGDKNDDEAMSEWTEPAAIVKEAKLDVPVGRFAQYRLTLKGTGSETPTITEMVISSVFKNLPPRVGSVGFAGTQDPDIVVITTEAVDPNQDKLLYTAAYSQRDSGVWITIKKDSESPDIKWDTRTVPDGPCIVRVTADDRLDNNDATKLSGYKDSETVIVDNTAPVIDDYTLESDGLTAMLKFTAVDNLTHIAKLEYNISGSDDWNAALPEDLLYDTLSEDFRIVVERAEPGDYVITVKVSDSAGNELYRSFVVSPECAETAGE